MFFSDASLEITVLPPAFSVFERCLGGVFGWRRLLGKAVEKTSTAAIDPTTTASWSYENSGPLDRWTCFVIGTSTKSPDTRPVFGLVLEGISLTRFWHFFCGSSFLGLLVLKRRRLWPEWNVVHSSAVCFHQIWSKWWVILFALATMSWSNYSDLTRPHPKWWFRKGNPLISGKPRLVKYYILARMSIEHGSGKWTLRKRTASTPTAPSRGGYVRVNLRQISQQVSPQKKKTGGPFLQQSLDGIWLILLEGIYIYIIFFMFIYVYTLKTKLNF